MPFLTVMTRCFYRPKALLKNVESLEMQTDHDFEQVLMQDPLPEGHGIPWANGQFYRNQKHAFGQYVYILDDDDFLTNPGFVSTMKKVAKERDWPDVIVFRWSHGRHGVLPNDENWGKEPVRGTIGSCSFIVRSPPWRYYIGTFREQRAGDYFFLKTLWDARIRFYWHDEVMGSISEETGHRGQPEEMFRSCP